MIERKGDLWAEHVPGYKPGVDPHPWIVITTNGETKANGDAVMGAGVAKKAAELFPDLPTKFGQRLRGSGHYVHNMGLYSLPSDLDKVGMSAYAGANLLRVLIAFPTKRKWRESARTDLIAKSAEELVQLVEACGVNKPPVVLLTRPGCGNGNLSWSTVRPILAKHLKDDRYVVVSE